MSSMAVDQAYLPGTSQRVTQNPMLPLHPVTAALDSQYVAAEAINRATTAKKYADILQQLGYTDGQGNFIPGSLSIQAQRTADDARFQEGLDVKKVNDAAQQGNAWFSGRRVADIANAEHPYETQIARLGVDLPVQLAQLHEQVAGLIDDYTLQNNKDLADAASRAASAYTDNPVGTGGAGSAPNTSGAPWLVNNPSDAGGRSAGNLNGMITSALGAVAGSAPGTPADWRSSGPLRPAGSGIISDAYYTKSNPLFKSTEPVMTEPYLQQNTSPGPPRPGMQVNVAPTVGRAAQTAIRSL